MLSGFAWLHVAIPRCITVVDGSRGEKVSEFYVPRRFSAPSLMSALRTCAASKGAQETIANAVSISSGGRPIFIAAEEETFVF